jgi:hypothetical protein
MLWAASASCLAVGSSAWAGTLRVAAYNVDLDTGTTTPNSSISQVLEDVGNETTYNGANPLGIIGLEETTSNATSVAPIVTSLNSYYGAGTYAMSTVQGTESGNDPTIGNGPSALIYNTKMVNLVASIGVGTPGGSSNGEYRQVMRYQFTTAGNSNPFYVYVLHSKSGSSSSTTGSASDYRSQEASIVTANEATLGTGASFIVMGDFNIDGTNEAVPTADGSSSYQKFIGSGLVDPINPTNASQTYGSGASAYKSILTESTQTPFSYRDDLQLVSGNVYNGSSSALTYVPSTEHAFGNNGSVSAGGNFNLSSSSPYKTELYNATDHLPIVADYSYTVAAPEPTSLVLGAIATAVTLGGSRGRRVARRTEGRQMKRIRPPQQTCEPPAA